MSSSTLVFPESLSTFKADRSAIRTQLRDTFNRLHSIAEDASFIDNQVAPAFPDFPIIANQRAGAWYVSPRKNSAHAYFKSTDGHAGEHQFVLRRANLGLLPLIKSRGGIVLVDSTRRGKRFPDALSKTIPMWCAVLNAAKVKLLPPKLDDSAVDPSAWTDDGKLWTLPTAVGRSEHSQIEKRISAWADELVASSYDLSELKTLDKPLRPIFVSPASELVSSTAANNASYYAVVCASASKLASEEDGMERARGFTYVQGSGDDHEAWSKGLTPAVFWAHARTILAASREGIDQVIADILSAPSTTAMASLSLNNDDEHSVRSTGISIRFATQRSTAVTSASPGSATIIIDAERGPLTGSPSPPSPADTAYRIPARAGKSGYSSFFSADILEPVIDYVTGQLTAGRRIVICTSESPYAQSEANDLGAALVIILLTRLYTETGVLRTSTHSPPASTPEASKPLIRARTQWLLEACPTYNPSRAVLQRINEYLLSPKSGNR